MEFRVAIISLGSLQQITSNRLSGPFGLVMDTYMRSLLKNVTYVEATTRTNGAYVIEKTNTSENTIFNIVSRKEADVLGMPLIYGQDFEGLESTGPFRTLQGAACNTPTLVSKPRDLTGGLVIYTSSTWLLIMVLTLLTSICLCMSKWNRNSSVPRTFITETSSCLVNQANMPTIASGAVLLVAFWLWTSFELMEIYENSMNAEMVTNDYRNVIESPDDIFRLNAVPVFINEDVFVASYRSTTNPRFQRLWNYPSKKMVPASEFRDILSLTSNEVYIGWDTNVLEIAKIICAKREPKIFVTDKTFGTGEVTLYYRIDLSDTHKSYIKKRVQTYAEHELTKGALDALVKGTLGGFRGTATCVRSQKEDLYDDVETLRPITITNAKKLFFILAAFTLLSSSGLMVEISRAKCSRNSDIGQA